MADPILSGKTLLPAYDQDSAADQIKRLINPAAKVDRCDRVEKIQVGPTGTRWFMVYWSVPGPAPLNGEIDHDRLCSSGHSAYDDHDGALCMTWGCGGLCNVNGSFRRRHAEKRRPIYR